MKISANTVDVLKNFSNINQSMFFKAGNVIRTTTALKNIFAQATVDEEFPVDFGIYDLNNFLSILSIDKAGAELEFAESHVKIISREGRSKVTYRYTNPELLVVPPSKKLVLPSVDVSVEVNEEDFKWIIKTSNVLQSPHIAVESDGSEISITTFDMKDDAAHTQSLSMGDGNGAKFKMIFKTENVAKIMSGVYKIDICRKGIAHFENLGQNLDYWIATEDGSKFSD